MNKNQLGLTLLEVLVSLAITALLFAGGAQLIMNKTDDVTIQGTAQYHTMLNNAATKYMQANFNAIAAVATDSNPEKVTFTQLRTAGYIPSSFATTSTNAFGQTGCVIVLEPSAGKLRALVVSEGGRDIPTGKLAYLATQIGMNGGYIEPAAPTVAKGAYGAWSQSLTDYTKVNCSGTAADVNNIASIIELDANGVLQEYVYRESLPNQPNASKMTAPLIMGAIKVEAESCTQMGAISRNSSGSILVCTGSPLTWTSLAGGLIGSAFWSAPVANKAELDALPCTETEGGQFKIILEPTVGDSPVLYACKQSAFPENSYAWRPFGVGDDGNFNDLYGAEMQQLNYLKITNIATEGNECNAFSKSDLARDSVTGAILMCQMSPGAHIIGYEYWKRPEDGTYRNTVYDINILKFYPVNEINGQVRTSIMEQKVFIRSSETPPTGSDSYIPLGKGPLVNATTAGTERITQINENYTVNQNTTITATCNIGTRISAAQGGMCSGAVINAGSPVSTNGWSCTSQNIAGARAAAIVFCKQ